MTERRFHDLLRLLLVRFGAPDSRFCFRNFAAQREIPADLGARVNRLGELAEKLGRHDSSVIYRFEGWRIPSPRHLESRSGVALDRLRGRKCVL